MLPYFARQTESGISAEVPTRIFRLSNGEQTAIFPCRPLLFLNLTKKTECRKFACAPFFLTFSADNFSAPAVNFKTKRISNISLKTRNKIEFYFF
jgi:hypothetical protein